MWVRKFFVFEKLAKTSNVCMLATKRVHIHLFYISTIGWLTAVNKRYAWKLIKNSKFELWEPAITILGHDTTGSDLMPISIIDIPDLKGLCQIIVS